MPRPRPAYLLYEMLGFDRLNDRFLYVTDGGHFENLGLVELFRRGCTRIYCFDASGDQDDTFFTIGEAVAIARSDIGVEVHIEPERMRPDKEGGLSPTDHVLGWFRYANGVEGYMVLAKAAVTVEAPWDVRAFKERDKRFPNHSTADQLFNDQKFEGYRALGRFTAWRAVTTLQAFDTTFHHERENRSLGDLVRDFEKKRLG